MNADKNKFTTLVTSSLVISLLAVGGCEKADMSTTVPPPAATTPPTPTPYAPPTAEQLLQMVAPIALFPDKLVAQVLAASTYPDQISAANQWLGRNPSLQGEALQNAANLQPWDVSVKSLTAFPAVLAQMANNIQWTTALGEAYANDPSDVMNAIQTMRLRAQQAGNLKTSQKMRVRSSPRLAPPPDYTGELGYWLIPPPSETIVIEAAQPDVVYVPDYNPALVYGAPIPVYPYYAYSSGNIITTGIISFGIGILVGSAIHHHNHGWGWHSWDMNWGGRGRGSGPDYGASHGWHRPAVVYNNSTYVTRSSSVIHRDHNSSRVTNNFGTPNNNGPAVANNAGRPGFSDSTANLRPQSRNFSTQPQNGSMTIPHFNSSDTRPGTRSNTQGLATQPRASSPHPAQAQHGAMSMPRFSSADTRPGARPAANSSGRRDNTNTPHSPQTRAAQRQQTSPPVNQRGRETRSPSETAQSSDSNRFQHRTGQNTISTENRQQHRIHTAPSQNTLRATDDRPNEIRQQHRDRDVMPPRSNPESIQLGPQVRDAENGAMPARINNRERETRPHSETGQSVNANGFAHQDGQNGISTENRQQNPLRPAPPPPTLRSNDSRQYEMRQQRREREAVPPRSNPEPVQTGAQVPPPPSRPQAHIPANPVPQPPVLQPRRVEPPHPQVQQGLPQIQQPGPQQNAQERHRRVRDDDRKER